MMLSLEKQILLLSSEVDFLSRNSKNARLHREAKSYRRAERKGDQVVSTGRKGPARTEPKHGKKAAWFQLYDSHGDFMKAQSKGKGRKKERDDE